MMVETQSEPSKTMSTNLNDQRLELETARSYHGLTTRERRRSERRKKGQSSGVSLVCLLVALSCVNHVVEASTSVPPPPPALSKPKPQGRKRPRPPNQQQTPPSAQPQQPQHHTQAHKKHPARRRRPNVIQRSLLAIKNDYNFKGFGWSFYKSLIFRDSFGAAFNIPMTFNFDTFERRPFLPSMTSSLCFFYPWSFILFINLSLPCELLRHILYLSIAYTQRILLLLLLFVTGGFSQKVPPFEPLPLRYSKNVQERVGASISWRWSADRGYEFRSGTWYIYLPTLECMLRMGSSVRTALEKKWWGVEDTHKSGIKSKKGSSSSEEEDLSDYDSEEMDLSDVDESSSSEEQTEDIATTTASSSTSTARSSKLRQRQRQQQQRRRKQLEERQEMLDWLRQRTASLGISAGCPIPDKPYYYTSMFLSLSGFQYVSLVREYLARQKRVRHAHAHHGRGVGVGSHGSSGSSIGSSNSSVKRKKVAVLGTLSSSGEMTKKSAGGVAPSSPLPKAVSGAERVSSVHVGGGGGDVNVNSKSSLSSSNASRESDQKAAAK